MSRARAIVWIVLLVAVAAAAWSGARWYESHARQDPHRHLTEAIFRLQVAASNRVKPTMPTADNPLVELDLKGAELTPALLEDLALMTSLRTLNLGITSVKDGDVKSIARLANLEELYLGSKSITDAAIANVVALQRLKLLDLGETSITDAALAELRKLPRLEELYLANTSITDAGLEHLKALPKLRLVFLDNTLVTAEGLTRLEKDRPELQVFGNPRRP